jgi:hypothetical protein
MGALAAAEGAMTPTLLGRLQTRVFLALIVGLPWTALVVPWLPLPAGLPDHTAYRIAAEALGLMTAAGLGWELVYHAWQQSRWDKDWPSLFMLLNVVNEAVPLWFLLHLLRVVHGTAALPFYVSYVATTWVMIWLFAQGPIRVLHVRWRFEGGQVLLFERPMAARMRRCAAKCLPRRRGGASSSSVWQHPGSLPAGVTSTGEGSGEPADDRTVEGVNCHRGHFCHPEMRYCPTCGDRLDGTDAPRVKGPRPPLGVLIGADGTLQVVDDDLDVMGGRVTVRIVGWSVIVSAPGDGVRVEFPGGCTLPAGPDTRIPLVSGAEVCAGGQRVRFEPLTR